MNSRLLLILFLFAFQVSAQNIPSNIPLNGLVGYWPFNGNANDESINGNNGIVNGGVPVSLTLDRFNLPNSAYNCDGISANNGNYLSISNPALVGNFGVNSFSISVWFKTIQIDGPILWFGAYATNNSVWYVRSYVNGYVLAGVSGGSNVISNNIFSDNEWHNAVYVRDANSFKSEIYVDGQLESQSTFTYLDNIVGAGNVNLRVGSNSYNTFFYGSIDDIAIYNRALSQVEISSLYNGVPTASISSQTNVNCYGQASGSATVNATSGTPPYTYSWNTTPIQTTATAAGLAAGTYTATVTDGNNQIDTTTVIITQPASAIEIFAHGSDPTCSANCNGTATVDVVGGTGPYSYLWNNGSTSQSISSLCTGNYSVTVTDANGCISSNSSSVPGCFQIRSIRVNSCSPTEWNEEMVFFQVGPNPLNTNSINVSWPTYPTSGNIWRGLCTNPAYIAAANATIAGGGLLLPLPSSGILPANANVLLVTENVLNSPASSYSSLSDTLYVLFQCSGNIVGHFTNFSASISNPLILNFGLGCSQSVNYISNSIPTIGGNGDGGYVLYSLDGTPTYLNYGCVLPNTIATSNVILSNPNVSSSPTVTNVSYCVGAPANPLTATGTNLLWYVTAKGGTGSTTAPTPSTSTAGTFTYYVSQTVGSCESPRSAITVTIGAAQSAAISYAGSPFCKSLTSAQSVTISGATGGIFSSTAGLTINASSGAIIPSSSTAGTYTVSYTIAASGGCSAVTTTTSVQIISQPTVTAPAFANICSGGSPNISLSSSTAGTIFIWTYSGGASGSGTGTPINNILTNTTCANIVVNYSITATINGCSGSALTVPVTVKQKPTSTFTLSSDTISMNENVVFTYTGTSCPGNTATPTFTAATIISGSGFGPYTLSWSTPGSYPILFQVSNPAENCVSSTYRDTVVVKAIPVASYTGITTLCSNQTSALTLSSSIAGTTYSWTVVQTGVTGASSGLGNSIAQTLITTGAVAGTAVYTVIPTANGNAGSPIIITVTVNPQPNTIITVGPTCSSDLLTWSVGVAVSGGILTSSAGTVLNTSGNNWTISGITTGTNILLNTNALGCQVSLSVTAPNCSCAPISAPVLANASYCSGSSIPTLTVTNGPPVGYTLNWYNVATGGSIIGTGTPFNPGVAGTYYAQFVEIASACTSQQTAATLTQNPLPTATISAAGSTTICAGANVVLNANTGSGLTYQWKLNGANINGAIAASYTATSAGEYTVVITNSSTCSTTSSPITISVNPIPTATISAAGPTSFCVGSNVVLNANTGTGLTYQWKLNGANISGATISSYTASTAGTYTVVITNTSSCSATSTATTVIVNSLPTAIITAASSTTFCAGSNVVLNANTESGLTYQWKLNETNISGAISASYTATSAGAYTVVVNNASSCSATSSATTISINPVPTATISAAGPTTFCAGANVLLNANNGSGLSYQWKLNGTNINGAIAPNYSANTSGVYSVLITNASVCSATSNNITVTVNPTPTLTLTSLPAFVSIQTASVALNGSPTGGSYSGQGIIGTNFIPSTAGLGLAVVSYNFTSSAGCSGNIVKNTIVFDTTGTVCTTYDTTYTSIIDTNYVTYTDSIQVIFNDTVLVSVQDTLIIETLILGSNPIQSNEIKVYPNPAHSYLEIDNGNFALMGGYTIRIENSLGQVVFNQAVNQQLFSINLSTWTGDGIYYLHIINSNGITQELKKIVLQ
jgi:hypothetical protein